MKRRNYAIMVEENSHYPVSYTIKQDGTKVIENTMLTFECLAKKRKSTPKLLIKHKLTKHKINIKLSLKPLFLKTDVIFFIKTNYDIRN